MDYITLSNGMKMPQLGYGVYQVTQEECERCVQIILTSACCISRFRIITAHGGHWRNYTRKEKFVLLVSLTSIRTAWWIFAPFLTSNQW